MSAKHACDVVVLLFCGTLNESSPELLGSDESDLVLLVWQLLDLNDNQVKLYNQYNLFNNALL